MSHHRRYRGGVRALGLIPISATRRTIKRAVRAVITWCEVFGLPLLLVCIAVSVMSAMLRSHDDARVDAMADARARVTLAVAASRLTRLAAWDPTFLSVAPSTPLRGPSSIALPRTDMSGEAADRDAFHASNVSRVLAILMRAYQDETSLHWIAVVDRDGMIRIGSDATAAGTPLPAAVVSRLRRAAETWSIEQLGERFIGAPIYDAFGGVVAFAVIGVDTALARNKYDEKNRQAMSTRHDATHSEAAFGPQAAGVVGNVPGAESTPRAPTSTASAMHAAWRWAGSALLITSVLAFGISVYAYWQARRQRALLGAWRIGWSRAYRRRRLLQHTLVILKEQEGARDVAEAWHGSMPASASLLLPGPGSVS